MLRSSLDPRLPRLLLVVLLVGGCATKQLKMDLESANDQITTLQQELEAAKQPSERELALQELADRRLERYRSLAEQLRAAYGGEGLSIKIRSGRMIVQLPNAILFDSGKVALKDEGKETLTKFAGVMQGFPERRFLVAGHTDNVPVKAGARFSNNWELSALRATTAASHLVEQGVQAKQIGAVGFGENFPDAPNDTDEGKATNRRLEIIVMPRADELPRLPKNTRL